MNGQATGPQLYDRRVWLQKGLIGSSLLTAAAFLPVSCASTPQPKDEPLAAHLAYLSPQAFEILSACGDALLPQNAPYPSHRKVGTVRRIDTELAQWDEVRREQIPLLLRLIEFGTLPFGVSFRRLSSLQLAEKRRYLAKWGDSEVDLFRSGFIALKGLLAFYYFTDPQVWPAIGYDGPWLGRFDIPITAIDGLPA